MYNTFLVTSLALLAGMSHKNSRAVRQARFRTQELEEEDWIEVITMVVNSNLGTSITKGGISNGNGRCWE